MSFFSKLFKLKKESAKSKNVTPESLSLTAFERRTSNLLSQNMFIARSDYKTLVEDFADLYSQFDTLRKTDTLAYFCRDKEISIQQVNSFLFLCTKIFGGRRGQK